MGGLPSHKLDELLNWSESQGLSLIAVQETKWRSSLQWKSQNWSLTHSGPGGSGQSYSGVLLGYRGNAQLRFDEVVPGRLLRVQITGVRHTLPLEVLACLSASF